MSQMNNMDALEKQLAELHMTKEGQSPGRSIKKIPPAVPPKKKAQPEVPQSAIINTLPEPLYSSKLPVCTGNFIPTYSNLQPSDTHKVEKRYVDNTCNTISAFKDTTSISPHNHTYNNIPIYKAGEDLPPPPPPPPIHVSSMTYDNNRNYDEYLPPPSPVSSNYSELVRATGNISYNDRPPYPQIYQNEFPTYGNSQNSTYESLYEPINPRPHSNISSQTLSTSLNESIPLQNRQPLPKEEEVDALTNLLVQSISDSQDLDVFGVCIKCTNKIIGEASGCTAMGNMYHVQCFSCHYCKTNLQGKPFYAVDGEPYCEADYYDTLEKCSVCDKPILDRILRATGKPYHPACFTCVVCGKSLDGIPFTVDALNQIHCIEDFHNKFAPRCCVCELPIMPEEGQEETVRVVALDRSFHVRCYSCEDCGMLLSSEAEGRGCYPLDNHILCKNCNAHRIRMLTNVMTTDL